MGVIGNIHMLTQQTVPANLHSVDCSDANIPTNLGSSTNYHLRIILKLIIALDGTKP